MEISDRELDILDHTIMRASKGMYCGDSPEMQSLVERGLMKCVGRLPYVPDLYFTITDKGKKWHDIKMGIANKFKS